MEIKTFKFLENSMNMKKTLLGLLVLISISVSAQTVVTITDADLVEGQNYTWSNDQIYLLDGYVFLEANSVLTIESGTVVKGKEIPTTGDVASALIIARGGKIFAQGTANRPIIFTSETDDTNDPDDKEATDRGEWGGIVILGNGIIGDETTESEIEGFELENDPRVLYGGDDNTDNSGVLRFISIRHGGSVLEDGDEINGLTLGGVGSGTTIEFVEVFANDDDGIEWFGGAVNVKFAAVSMCADDPFDWDDGFVGKGQFWFGLQAEDDGGNGGEHDGAHPDDNPIYSDPTVYNATYIGMGKDNTNDPSSEYGILFRDGTAGDYANSIITDFSFFAIQVEDTDKERDSRGYLESGDLTLKNNIWFGFGEGSELSSADNPNSIIGATDVALDNAQWLVDHLAANSNTLEDPMIKGISRNTDGNLDPRTDDSGPAYSNLAAIPDDGFFTETTYKGAFGASLWIRDWTALDEYGFLPARSEVVIRDEDLLDGNYTWTSDNIYLLDGYVFLEAPGALTIEPGTIIKGQEIPSTGDVASALIIARGAKIFAEGTCELPIIFTSESDDVSDPDDKDVTDRGEWGGLVVLGNGIIGDETTESEIEGFELENDPRVLYGGNDNTDNSGIISYVSIRHGGSVLEDGDEINGLTLGAVGSGTNIHHVEVFANDDDGIEWFGGAASIKYAAVSFCADDPFDWDDGFVGNGQFWFGLQGEDDGGNGGEHDGAHPDDNPIYSDPNVYNATYIGMGADNTNDPSSEYGILFRDGTAGDYANSIITDFSFFAIQVEDTDKERDSRGYLESGDLTLKNNIWFGFGEGTELLSADNPNSIIGATDVALDNAQWLVDHLAANGNSLDDPQIGNISRAKDGTLDPRPNEAGPAFTSEMADLPADPFFDEVSFKGAFGNGGTWLGGWTALSEYGILDPSIPQDEDCQVNVSTDKISTESYINGQVEVSPNPSIDMQTSIRFNLKRTAKVQLVILNQLGQIIQTPINHQIMFEGENVVQLDLGSLQPGVFYFALQVDNGKPVTGKAVFLK